MRKKKKTRLKEYTKQKGSKINPKEKPRKRKNTGN